LNGYPYHFLIADGFEWLAKLKGVPMILDDIDFMVYSVEHHEQLKQNNLFDHWNFWMFNH